MSNQELWGQGVTAYNSRRYGPFGADNLTVPLPQGTTAFLAHPVTSTYLVAGLVTLATFGLGYATGKGKLKGLLGGKKRRG